RRAAARRVRASLASDRSDRRQPSRRRGCADRRPRRRDQRLSLPPARRLVQLPLAHAHRQLLPDDRSSPAPRVRERHGASSAVGGDTVVRRLGASKEPGAGAVTILVALFGGIALLLYGIRLSGEALQRVLGV